jgi:hypothetical protein
MNNFDDERQDEFFARADVRFRRWKRYQLSHDLKEQHLSWWAAQWRRTCSLAYEVLAGFGYKPWRFVAGTVIFVLALSGLNYELIGSSLALNGQLANPSFLDTVYYTFSVLKVLGPSPLSATTTASKLLTGAEALAAIGWLAIFTSLLVKRFLR